MSTAALPWLRHAHRGQTPARPPSSALAMRYRRARWRRRPGEDGATTQFDTAAHRILAEARVQQLGD